jgi:hypothetical protein
MSYKLTYIAKQIEKQKHRLLMLTCISPLASAGLKTLATSINKILATHLVAQTKNHPSGFSCLISLSGYSGTIILCISQFSISNIKGNISISL